MPRSDVRHEGDLDQGHGISLQQLKHALLELPITMSHADSFRRVDAARAELPLNDAHLQAAGVDLSGALVLILNGAGQVRWMNRACELATGYSSQELQGRELSSTPLAAGDTSFPQISVSGVPSGEPTSVCECRWVSRQEQELRIIWSITTLPGEKESVAYVVGTGVNVTGRRSLQQNRTIEQLRLHSLLEISQKAAELSEFEIIRHTLEEVVRLTESEIGYLHFVNPDQESICLFAWSEGALRSCTAAHDSHYPISQAGVWADCARRKRPVVHNDYQTLPDRKGYPQGHSHLVRHASVPILDRDEVVIILGVGNKAEDYDDTDIRQMLLAADSLWKIVLRKRAEDELREHVRALQEADRQKDEFLAMLAHELRNPLAPVRTALQILDQPGANRRLVEQATRVICRQVQHMTRLVDDLLDVARITRGKIELQRERLDLVEIVSGAIELNRAVIKDRNHTLTISHPASDVIVSGDPVRLTQVVSNLLQNAAKYTPEGGRIGVTIELTSKHAVLRVKDSGVGIAASMLPRVFDMFAQADASLDRSQGGLGLGLTLVRKLVELHGGGIEAVSGGVNQGSEFVVRLPSATEIGQRDAKTSEDCATAPAAGLRILVVDDNEDAAEMLASWLGLVGHCVESVQDGPSALALLQSFPTDVVLLDIGLPGMDGYQVAKQIRQNWSAREVLLIAVTGYGHEAAIRSSREAGFDHHLVKPLNLEALSRLLSGHQHKSMPELGQEPGRVTR